MNSRKEEPKWHICLMKILYKDKKVEKLCTDIKYSKQQLGNEVSIKLFSLINLLSNSKNLMDILAFPQYHLHKLKGNKDGIYSMYLGRKTGFRMEIIPLDDNEQEILNYEMNIYAIAVCLRVERISKHYE